MTLSTRSVAMMRYSPPNLTKEYSSEPPRQMASLAGRVQVVVVQITNQVLSMGMPYLASTPLGSWVTWKRTKMESQSSSPYSISASARAVRHSGHQ